MDIKALQDPNLGHDPLVEYPWCTQIDKLLNWAKNQDTNTKCFIFDLVMSLAFVDATSGLEKYLEFCPNSPPPFNHHLGFVNLCSPCFESKNIWVYQKAAKPQSGALGKLSSEIILRFVKIFFSQLKSVKAIGGTEYADALLRHQDGFFILAEVKSAPLITFPVLFSAKTASGAIHKKVSFTSSQLKEFDSCLYLHQKLILPLGKPKGRLWPFKPAVDFFLKKENLPFIEKAVAVWTKAKTAYQKRDKDVPLYYLANASGSPPQVAKDRDNWPKSESISDSKTSAGMDRTDDIKKGIYQVLKMGASLKSGDPEYHFKTAIISNLPAYRHGQEYVVPFNEMLWGLEKDLEPINDLKVLRSTSLRRVYDYLITIDEPLLRGIKL